MLLDFVSFPETGEIHCKILAIPIYCAPNIFSS